MKKYLLKAIYFISPVILTLILYFSDPTRYSNVGLMITMILGSFAYTWISVQFILSARPKFIERIFGMDYIYRFHGKMAIIGLLIAIIHAIVNEQIVEESIITTIGGLSLGIFILISLLTMLSMSPSFILKYRSFKWLKKRIEGWKKFTYEQLRFIHNFTVVAYLILNIHVLLTPNAQQHTYVFLVYVTYFVISLMFYVYHKFIKSKLLQNNKYTIVEVLPESSNVWTIKMIGNNSKINNHVPGQFAFFTFNWESNNKQEHPFSISSASDSYISITVKELGDFTGNIGELKNNDSLLVEGPFGRFSYLLYPNELETVFICGGIGITPILSMLRHMSMYDPKRKVLLVWGINSLDDYICKNDIENIKTKMENLTIVPVVSRDENYIGEKGYINKDILEKYIQKKQFNFQYSGYYVCGPSIMMDLSMQALKEIGISMKKIHFEKFSL
ncbi:MAG: hypothetical protein AB7U52_03810 [Candidatus Izemoplasmatales bacterium]